MARGRRVRAAPVLLGLALLVVPGAGNAEGDEQCLVSGTCSSPSRFDEGNMWTIDEDIENNCPAVFGKSNGRPIMRTAFRFLATVLRMADQVSTFVTGKELLTQGWADHYTAAAYMFVVQIAMRFYWARDPSFVNVPDKVATNESIKVGNIYAPHVDVDGYPNFLWFEKYIPDIFIKPFYIPALTCFYNGLRELDFTDDIDIPFYNAWPQVLKSGRYKSKKDWLLAFYTRVHTFGNRPTWPPQRVDYTGLFRRGDMWEDGLEKAIAFDGIGAHRIEQVSREAGGEILPYAIKLNSFAAFEVRPGFGKYGGDMYFTAEGIPVLIVTPDGREVLAGDKDWQYWKFVWRSSLVTVITLCDHLHFTHFKASNMLARASRMGLPPDHAYRRVLSIFTFGAIFVNLQAQFTLTGTNMLLNRATPFKDFAMLSEAVPQMLPDISEMPGLYELVNSTAFDALPQRLRETPFFADGQLIMKIFMKFTSGLFESVGSRFCRNGQMTDPAFMHFIAVLKEQVREASYKAINYDEAAVECALMEHRLATFMFIVTAWHSHVGFVGDYYADPDLVVMSWRDGERSGPPRQTIITSIINVFTSTKQPALMDDYTHLFKGISEDSELTRLWRVLLSDLLEAKKVIDMRNSGRNVTNIQFSPEVLESSVAK